MPTDELVLLNPTGLHNLASSPSRNVRLQVVSNPHTRADTLAMLAHEESNLSDIHVAIAENENTSTETLTHLYKKASGSRIGNFFKYLYTPYDSIAIKPINEDILLALCVNPNTSVEILLKLAKSNVYSVRLRVTYNANLPLKIKTDVLSGFIVDRKLGGHSENRALAAIDHPDLPAYIRVNALAQLIADGYTDAWRQVASFNFLNHTTVKALLESGDEAVKENLLQNTRLTEASYAVLAGEPESEQDAEANALPKESQIRKYRLDLSRLRHAERFNKSSISKA
jgi:hypothetical protein